MDGVNESGRHGERKLSVDAVADLLSVEPRRRIVATLADYEDEQMRVDALVEEVAPERKRQFEIKLHHTHLPKLEAHGVVERDGDVIRYRETPCLEEWLDVTTGDGW